MPEGSELKGGATDVLGMGEIRGHAFRKTFI